MLTKLYHVLEEKFPSRVKWLIPQKWRIWIGYRIKVAWRHGARKRLPRLDHPLILPAGETEQSLKDFLSQFYIKGEGQSKERSQYLEESFKRFLYTLQIVPNKPGKLLEIGANPYFMSLLLMRFAPYELTFANYFWDDCEKRATQALIGPDGSTTPIEYDNINLEMETMPYETDFFDVVLLCEVLEHFTNDPHRALVEIKRVLKPQGALVLTTPNMARLENIARLLSGDNIYDPYSGYGPYGRHNREYTTREIGLLLDHVGFTVEQIFTSDIRPPANVDLSASLIESLPIRRRNDLGQFIFVRATNSSMPNRKKPRWLYRSYPDEGLV